MLSTLHRPRDAVRALIVAALLALISSGLVYADAIETPSNQPEIWRIHRLANPTDVPPLEAYSALIVTRAQLQGKQTIELQANKALWLEITADPQTRSARFFLQIAAPHLWSAVLYERLSNGQWQEESAGVSVPQSKWPYPAVMPLFRLTTATDADKSYWVRLMHDRAALVDLQIHTETGLAPIAWGSIARAGVLFGMFTLLVLYAALQAFVQKSDSFLWLALYTTALGVAAACISGHAPLLLWRDSVWLTYGMRGAMPALALCALITFVGLTSPAARRGRWAATTLWISGFVSLSLAAAATTWAYTVPPGVFSVLFVAAFLAVFWVCVQVGSMHNPWPLWIAISVTPVVAMTLLYLLANWIPSSWTGEHRVELLAWGMLAHALVLSVALVARLRHFWSVRARADSSGDADPLTGLILPSIALQRRWPTMVRRAQHSQRPCGAILVEWLNIDSIAKQANQTVIQRLTLNAAARLTGLVRDIDVLAMPNPSGFLVLLESPISREDIREMCIRIVAEGLKINKERDLNFPLQFAVVGAACGKLNLSGEELMVILGREIREMLASDIRRVRAIDLP